MQCNLIICVLSINFFVEVWSKGNYHTSKGNGLRKALSDVQQPQSLFNLYTILPKIQDVLVFDSQGIFTSISKTYPMMSEMTSHNYTSLRQYNVHPDTSVSGISGGGSYSSMLQFIHSSIVKAGAIYAGAPYATALVAYQNPTGWANVEEYYPIIDKLNSQGVIDNTSNIASNVGQWIHRGIYDFTPQLFPGVIAHQLKHYGMPSKKIKMVTDKPVGHCIPIKKGRYDQTCVGDDQAICACHYQSSVDLFSVIYPGDFKTPSHNKGHTTGKLFKFDQREFYPDNNAKGYGMWDFAYAYVPSKCEDGAVQCRLHFSFHGCSQNDVPNMSGETPEYLTDTGFLNVADANDIIMIFPQARINLAVGAIGCFDIYGFTSPGKNTFSTKAGIQPTAFRKMYDRILSGAGAQT